MIDWNILKIIQELKERFFLQHTRILCDFLHDTYFKNKFSEENLRIITSKKQLIDKFYDCGICVYNAESNTI
jgi:hypothetical protein